MKRSALIILCLAAFFCFSALSSAAYVQRVICGNTSATYTDMHGCVWSLDQTYTAGSWGYYTPGNYSKSFPDDFIENTFDCPLYKSERLSQNYRFTVPPGRYFIKLLFCENWWGLAQHPDPPHDRIFNVSLNGATVLTNFSILGDTGGRARRAVIKSFAVTVSNLGTYANMVQSESATTISWISRITVRDANGRLLAKYFKKVALIRP